MSLRNGKCKDKEIADTNHIDGHNGVILTGETFKDRDQNSAEKQLCSSEIIWQIFAGIAIVYSVHSLPSLTLQNQPRFSHRH